MIESPAPPSAGILSKSLDRLGRNALSICLLAVGILYLMGLVPVIAAQLFQVGELGFGDAWVLLGVRGYETTGVIYPAPDRPSPIPGVVGYGPFLYWLFALAHRWFDFGNPFVGPRIMILVAFLACALFTTSIARKLMPGLRGALWTALFSTTFACMQPWILQLRGDLFSVALNLLSVRLLMADSTIAIGLAGAAAGLATQFKFVYVAALGAGTLWLLATRRWKHAGVFVMTGLFTSVGLYLAVWLREPAMPAHVFLLRSALKTLKGLPGQFNILFREPGLLLGLVGAYLVLKRPAGRWRLLLLYAGLSLALSALADLQVGANINYFFEVLFALAPFAAWTILQLAEVQPAVVQLAMAALIFSTWALPTAATSLERIRSNGAPVQEINERLQKLGRVVAGKRVLSTIPNVIFLTGEPVVDEPFLLGHLYQAGKLNVGPLVRGVQAGDFDLLAVDAKRAEYRGIRLLPEPIRDVMGARYRPFCVYNGGLFFTRSTDGNGAIEQDLVRIGCRKCDEGAACANW